MADFWNGFLGGLLGGMAGAGSQSAGAGVDSATLNMALHAAENYGIINGAVKAGAKLEEQLNEEGVPIADRVLLFRFIVLQLDQVDENALPLEENRKKYYELRREFRRTLREIQNGCCS